MKPKWETFQTKENQSLLFDGTLSSIVCEKYLRMKGRTREKPFGFENKSIYGEKCHKNPNHLATGFGYKLCKNREYINSRHYHWIRFKNHIC